MVSLHGMMDIEERADYSWTDNRSEVMSAFLMRMSEFFCPSDRELALRGQIKTGWSTVAARKKSRPSEMKLPPQELKHIEAVVAQAEALQVAEEIRIGVQMLKLQRLRKSCRGNGTSTCILCGYDLVHHRSRSLSSIHVCHECAQAVCSRCKAEYKCLTGETVVLCRLCSDERELWKKSGAWLNNKLPVINVSEEELVKAQQQRQMTHKVGLPMRTDFMVPASHLDEDDDELEDDISTISGSTANYGGFSVLAGSAPSSRSPSPDVSSFMTEANAAAAAWKGDRQTAAELHPQSYKTLPLGKSPIGMKKSGSYDLVAIRNQKRASTLPSKERTSSISRKPAMGGERKERMEELRRRVVEKKRAADRQRYGGGDSQQRPPSPPTLSVDPLKMKRSRSNDFPVANPRLSPVLGATSPHPHIKVVVATPPTSPDIMRGEPRSESPLIESTMARESTPKSQDHETTRAATNDSPSSSQQSAVEEEGRKRKPVPSPRRKQATPEVEAPPLQQGSQDGGGEFSLVADAKKFATIEREKPSAAPRRRTASLDKEKGREYRSLERRQKAGRAPEPQPSSEFKTVSSRKTPVGESKSTFSAMLPAEVTSELKSALSKKNSNKEESEQPNPHLKEIGKTLSITSEGSVDSQQGEGVTRADSGSSGEHTWRRQRAMRTTGRRQTGNYMEGEEDESSPRARSRSGAVSGGGRGARRSQQTAATEEDEPSSRSRTRSGAMSGNDAQGLRRGRNNARVSPRPARRGHSGAGAETDGFPEPSFEQFGSEEAESIRRARVANRRVARTGGDLLVATDGQYGSVELCVEYLSDQILSVTVHRCRGLPGVDGNGLSDPYVKLFLTPAPKKHVVFKTVILRHTVNPQFDQNFVFHDVTPDCLEKKSLTLVVLDRHDASKDHPIGGISVPLYEVTPGQRTNIRKLLGDPEKAVKEVLEKTEVGKVELNFSYDAVASLLKVGVNQAVILMPRSKHYPNSYITGQLQTQTMSVNIKRKTKTVNRAAMPIFDQVLEFSVASAHLSVAVLTLSMWDHRKVAKDIFLGQLVLKGRKFWEKVKSLDLLNHEWYHLQEHEDCFRVPSPLFATL